MSEEFSPLMQGIREKMAVWVAESLSPEERKELEKWAVTPMAKAIPKEPVDKWSAVFGHIAEAMGVTAPLSYSQRNTLHDATNEICETLDNEKPLVDTYWIYQTVMNAVGTQFTQKFRGYSQHIIDVTNKCVAEIVETYYREEATDG